MLSPLLLTDKWEEKVLGMCLFVIIFENFAQKLHICISNKTIKDGGIAPWLLKQLVYMSTCTENRNNISEQHLWTTWLSEHLIVLKSCQSVYL